MGKDINRDLDKYLSARRDGKRSLFTAKSKQQVEEPVPEINEDGVTIEHEKPTLWSRLFGGQRPVLDEDLTEEEQARLEAMEQEIEAVEEAEEMAGPEEKEMLEEARESLIARLFKQMRFFQARHELNEEIEAVEEAEEALEEEKAQMEEDTKEVLRIAHHWLGKLTKRQKDAFKESSDFKKYCDILEKHGIAKRK